MDSIILEIIHKYILFIIDKKIIYEYTITFH